MTEARMQRSSESIAKLAAALAKAQGELVNPEKSLVATIKAEGTAGQTFRYAPLSSGLDIVRKTLGHHEIAVVQTTSTDPNSATITLTTMLAHASGEWIASDWPVCAVGETATPHRMDVAVCKALYETEIWVRFAAGYYLPQRRFPNTPGCLILYESL
jgi:hypothetical protein